MNTRSRRGAAAVGLGVAVATGLVSRAIHLGWFLWDKSVGDVASAVMVGFLVQLVRPRTSAIVTAGLAIAICFAIELFQLTGLLAHLPRALRIVLGDTFAWHDVSCYAFGGAVAGLVVFAQARSTGPKNASG